MIPCIRFIMPQVFGKNIAIVAGKEIRLLAKIIAITPDISTFIGK